MLQEHLCDFFSRRRGGRSSTSGPSRKNTIDDTYTYLWRWCTKSKIILYLVAGPSYYFIFFDFIFKNFKNACCARYLSKCIQDWSAKAIYSTSKKKQHSNYSRCYTLHFKVTRSTILLGLLVCSTSFFLKHVLWLWFVYIFKKDGMLKSLWRFENFQTHLGHYLIRIISSVGRLSRPVLTPSKEQSI